MGGIVKEWAIAAFLAVAGFFVLAVLISGARELSGPSEPNYAARLDEVCDFLERERRLFAVTPPINPDPAFAIAFESHMTNAEVLLRVACDRAR